MADGTYFVGRNELLAWINSTLDLNLTKIEQTANGAVACQLMDVLYNGAFPMQKIDFNANNEYAMINNYKVLQAFFNKRRIEKSIEVNKLIKGRPLDNMEFIQWLKAFWDKESGDFEPDEDYDAVDRRQICKTGDIKETSSSMTSSQSAQKAPAPTHASGIRQGASKMPTSASTRPRSKGSSAAKHQAPAVSPASKGTTTTTSGIHRTPKSNRDDVTKVDHQAEERIKDLTEQLTEMRMTAEESVREREFYYGKLREIEILCQTPTIGDQPMMKIIEQILYAPNEEEARAIVTKCQMDNAGNVFAEADEEVENGADDNQDP
eukprot:g5522.t1